MHLVGDGAEKVTNGWTTEWLASMFIQTCQSCSDWKFVSFGQSVVLSNQVNLKDTQSRAFVCFCRQQTLVQTPFEAQLLQLESFK